MTEITCQSDCHYQKDEHGKNTMICQKPHVVHKEYLDDVTLDKYVYCCHYDQKGGI
jgi:hypothetical protein